MLKRERGCVCGGGVQMLKREQVRVWGRGTNVEERERGYVCGGGVQMLKREGACVGEGYKC